MNPIEFELKRITRRSADQAVWAETTNIRVRGYRYGFSPLCEVKLIDMGYQSKNLGRGKANG